MATQHCLPTPETIFHSDQGCEYASKEYRRVLESFGLRVSMSRKDRGEIQQLRGEAASSAALVAAKIGRTRSKEMQTMVAAARSAMQAGRTQQVCEWV